MNHARIWIELDKPPALTAMPARLAFYGLQCQLANNFLKRLIGPDCTTEFSWSAKERMYMYGQRHGSYEYLPDRGKWLNLSYFGRPIDETPEQYLARSKYTD